MRKTKKMLALALASALMVTSVQVNWDVTAYAAVQEGAETNGSRQVVSNAITWNMDYLSSDSSCEISDQNVPTTKMEYTSGTYYVSSLNFPNLSGDMVQFDAGKLSQVLGGDADQLQSLTVNDLTFRYRWSKAGDDGSYVSIEETTDTYDADEDITNENHTTTYRCTAIVTEVGGHKVPEGTDIPLTWDFVYQYTGVTKDQIDSGEVSIADHFEIEDFTSDAEIIRFASKSEEKNPSYFYINGQDFDDDRIDCKLSCIYKDGTEEQIQVLEDRSSLSNSSFDALTYSRNGKDVDHYNLHIDLKYGKQVLQSMDKVYNLEYTGITKEDVEQNPEILNTYFEGLKDLTDQDLNFTNVNSSQSAGCEIDSQFYGNATINYEWIAHAVDGTTESVISRTSQNSCASRRLSYYYDFSVKDQQGNITDTERKPVDYYELSVVLCYDGEELATRTAKYNVVFSPIKIVDQSSSPFMARNGETKRLYVEAEQADDTEDIGTITYQWYKVKNGTATPLEGENLSETYVKVEDYNTSYKCVISATELKDAYPDIELKELSAAFVPREATGYRVKAIEEYPSSYLGKEAVLSIKTAVDSGYTLNYKWEKASYENQNSDTIIYTTKADGASAEYKIAQTTEDDFVSVYDDTLERSYTHRLTVTVKKGTEIVDTSYYYFRLRKIIEDLYTVDTNLDDWSGYKMAVEKGEDTELYFRTEVQDSSLTIEKTWFKKLMDVDYVAETDTNGNYVYDTDGNLKYKTADAGVTVPAAPGKTTEQVDYDSEIYDNNAGQYIYTKKTVTYYEKLTAAENNSVYKVLGKDGTGKAMDNRGTYHVDVKVTKNNGSDTETLSEDTYFVTLIYNSGLKAYAKTSNISGAVGKSAVLEVVASNKDQALYPITYQWQKWDVSKNAYQDMQGVTGNVNQINSLTANDFGRYRVMVSDSSDVEPQEVIFFVYEEQTEPHFYTPQSSYYRKSIGDAVALEVKADIPASVKVDYTWYCSEKYLQYDPWEEEWNEYTDADWQILNTETAAYTFTVSSEEDFRTYRCMARYKLAGSYVEKNFYYHVEDASADISLERTTPQIQYKQVGDSAAYGVRYKSASSEIKDADVKYQWGYYDDNYDWQAIEGATGQNYTVKSLEAKNFGTIYCRVTFSERNLYKSISFETRLYTDITIAEGGTVYAQAGSDVILEPVIGNPSNRALTYQWYSEDYGIIYGATGKNYTISKIGENEFGTYYCKIYDGNYLVGTYQAVIENTLSKEKKVLIDKYESNIKVTPGKSAEFKITAKSDSNLKLSYQWYRNEEVYDEDEDEYYNRGKAIGGAVEASYTINSVLPNMEGNYYCIVTDSEGNRARADFYLTVSTNLQVDSGYVNSDDLIGYQTTIGADVTLKAKASIDKDYQVFYQWYRGTSASDNNVIYGATAAEYKLNKVSMNDIGYYICKVSDAIGTIKYLYYQVYINTGLMVEPSMSDPFEAADGSVKMYVQATANQGQKITYQWSKYDANVDKWTKLSNGTSASYKIAKVTKNTLGEYMCTVSTSGESYSYLYSVHTVYQQSQSRNYAEQNDAFKLSASMKNSAKDAKYTYIWYAEDPVTKSQKKISCTTASYSGKAPVIKMNGSISGFVSVGYTCEVYRDGILVSENEYTLGVLPKITYSTTTLPQTSHPFDKRVDIKAYKVNKAKKIKITLDIKSEEVMVIDASGFEHWMSGAKDNTMNLAGDKAIFIARNGDGIGYGYKVSSIVDPNPATPTPPKPQKPKVPAKGKKYTVGKLKYKVTKSSAKSGTVSVTGAKSKSATSVSIPKTVKISGYTFKVTGIDAKAFSGYKKLTKAVIGENVKSIGKSAFRGCAKLKTVTLGKNVTAISEAAFSGCKSLTSITIGAKVSSIGKEAFKSCAKLKTITIKTTKLTSKKVGKNAFKGINAKATIKVPSKKLAAYKKLLKAKGVGKKVKFKKVK
ncbi:leucine-rich repeat protein [Lachnospiraceae bacterium 66-29]